MGCVSLCALLLNCDSGIAVCLFPSSVGESVRIYTEGIPPSPSPVKN